jgi:hypothetical protein
MQEFWGFTWTIPNDVPDALTAAFAADPAKQGRGAAGQDRTARRWDGEGLAVVALGAQECGADDRVTDDIGTSVLLADLAMAKKFLSRGG